MGAEYTEAQKKATKKYMESKHTIRLTVNKADADRYKAQAKAMGQSLTKFIIDCIEREMD